MMRQPMRAVLSAVVVGVAVLVANGCGSSGAGPTAPTACEPVAIDPERDPRIWLEEVEGAAALEWVRGENAQAARRLLDDPRYAEYFAQALEVHGSRERIPLATLRDGYAYNFWQDAAHPHGVWRRATLASYLSPDTDWEIVFDLDALAAAEGVNWVWSGAVCAPPPATRCLLALSNGGLDAAQRREFDLDRRAFVAGGFVIPETKGTIAWDDADTLLIATVLDPAEATTSGYPSVVKRWSRGTPIEQASELLRGALGDVSVTASRLDGTGGEAHLMVARHHTFFEHTYYVASAAGAPQALPLPARAELRGLFRGQLVFSIDEDWRPAGSRTGYAAGALLSFDLAAFLSDAVPPPVSVVFTPGPRQAVRAVGVSAAALLLVVDENVSGGLYALDFDGTAWTRQPIATPRNLTISLSASGPTHDIALLGVEGLLTPPSLYVVDAAARTAHVVKSSPAWFDSDGLLVEQHLARSADGTEVPYFLVRRADLVPNGDTPVFLHAYGGFQISSHPTYSGVTGRLWLARGGAFALANIRGGGEFGPAWHEAGLRTHRQRVYDDLIAVAEDLIDRGVTRPARLGVNGRSNGGLLTGVMYVQRPDLFAAVVSGVPLLDMLRYHRLLAGASWMAEYGDPDDPREGAFLRATSPYHNVCADAVYPEIFLYTSTKDDRVHPGHARKMAHLLAELGHPYVYFENLEGGHAAAANPEELARRDAMLYVFMAQRLMGREAIAAARGAHDGS